MKRFLTLLITLLLATTVIFANASEKVLGIVMPNATHGFLGESIKHARASAEEYAKTNGFQ
ncbi:MAG: sugar ABC transporter substrate-binding protein, partial [Cetobacterium sp.]